MSQRLWLCYFFKYLLFVLTSCAILDQISVLTDVFTAKNSVSGSNSDLERDAKVNILIASYTQLMATCINLFANCYYHTISIFASASFLAFWCLLAFLDISLEFDRVTIALNCSVVLVSYLYLLVGKSTQTDEHRRLNV